MHILSKPRELVSATCECGAIFVYHLPRNGRRMAKCMSCRITRTQERKRACRHTDNYREKHRQRANRWRQTDHGKQYDAEYRQRPEVQSRHRKGQSEFRNSEEGKACRREYLQRPEVMEQNRISQAERRTTPEGQAYLVEYRKRPHVREKQTARNKQRRKITGRDLRKRLPTLLKIQDWRCALCGGIIPRVDNPFDLGRKVHIDHIVPVVHGGGNDLHNLQATHQYCNIKKGAARWNGPEQATLPL